MNLPSDRTFEVSDLGKPGEWREDGWWRGWGRGVVERERENVFPFSCELFVLGSLCREFNEI
jgi:hypothetical protein